MAWKYTNCKLQTPKFTAPLSFWSVPGARAFTGFRWAHGLLVGARSFDRFLLGTRTYNTSIVRTQSFITSFRSAQFWRTLTCNFHNEVSATLVGSKTKNAELLGARPFDIILIRQTHHFTYAFDVEASMRDWWTLALSGWNLIGATWDVWQCFTSCAFGPVLGGLEAFVNIFCYLCQSRGMSTKTSFMLLVSSVRPAKSRESTCTERSSYFLLECRLLRC